MRNVVERAVALSNGPMLDAPDVWLSSLDAMNPAEALTNAYQPMTLQELERIHIQRTLEFTEVEQEPHRGDPRHRTLDVGSQDRSCMKLKLLEIPPCRRMPAGRPRNDRTGTMDFPTPDTPG